MGISRPQPGCWQRIVPAIIVHPATVALHYDRVFPFASWAAPLILLSSVWPSLLLCLAQLRLFLMSVLRGLGRRRGFPVLSRLCCDSHLLSLFYLFLYFFVFSCSFADFPTSCRSVRAQEILFDEREKTCCGCGTWQTAMEIAAFKINK